MSKFRLQCNFDSLKELITFYTHTLKKPQKETISTVASMKLSGQISTNENDSITVTWYFRQDSKYLEFSDAYVRHIEWMFMNP